MNQSAGSAPLRVGYQGGPGAFSELAVMRHFSRLGTGDPEHIGFRDFRSMLEAVSAGELDYALLPVENSIAGSIHESYDLLRTSGLHIVGEEILRIVHCLIGLRELPLEQLTRVYSHPVALAQCREFIRTVPGLEATVYHDTAEAVRFIRDEGKDAYAAIASERAAELYGLPILRRDIADHPENFTRMVLVSREPEGPDQAPNEIPEMESEAAAKTSLIFGLPHQKGALARVISLLAERDLNLAKIESRPYPMRPFEYIFYLDFLGSARDEHIIKTLRELSEITEDLRVLGSYRAAQPGR